MEMKVRVKTPVGHAKVTSNRIDIRTLLLFRTKAKIKKRYVNPENDEFIWVIDVPVENYLKVQRNLAMFSMGTYKLLSGIAKSKIVKKFIEEGQEAELDKMLRETKIEVLNNKDAREVVDHLVKETRWQKIRRTWEGTKENWMWKKK